MIPGPWRHVFEGFGEPRDSLLPRYQAFPSALHGPDNRRSTKTPGNFDHRRREFPGAPAGFRVKIGQAQFVNHPAGAGSHCRQPEPMLRQEAFTAAVNKNKELPPLEAALLSQYPDVRRFAVEACGQSARRLSDCNRVNLSSTNVD